MKKVNNKSTNKVTNSNNAKASDLKNSSSNKNSKMNNNEVGFETSNRESQAKISDCR